MTPLRGRGPVIALAAMLAALGLVAWTLWRALIIDPVDRGGRVDLALEADTVTHREPLDPSLIGAALDQNPFHPERRRPRERFRLPSERRTPTARRPAPPSGLPASMVLTGTMAYGDGGGVAILRDRGVTRLVRVGEQVGELTLRQVDPEEVVFVSASGARIVVRVSNPGG